MQTLPVALKVLLIVYVLTCAGYDLRFRRIPNWLNLAGLSMGLILNGLLLHWTGLLDSGCGLMLAVIVYLPLYLLSALGAGDVKLMAAIGAIAGPRDWLYIFLATCLAGGVLGFCVAVAKRRLNETLLNTSSLASSLLHFRAPRMTVPSLSVGDPNALKLPHGFSIAVGAITFLLLEKTILNG
jgi:prepilin peptidase CpaA